MSVNPTFDLLCKSVPTISVGILTADIMHLAKELSLLRQTDVKIIHFDVMDGFFVPKMTVGPPFIKGIQTNLLKDVHLMIRDPLEKIEDYINAGANIITVHIESAENIQPVLKKLGAINKSQGRALVRGIALNPDTPVYTLESLLDDVEMIVLLAVDPTVKGMPFFADIGRKCAQVKEIISNSKRKILLCIDGGIKRSNIAEISRIGADIVVTGSAVFDGKAVVENAHFMLSTIKSKIEKNNEK